MQSPSDWLAIGALVISIFTLLFGGGGILLFLFRRKPVISIGNALAEFRGNETLLYFDVVNRGKVEANNFLLQVKLKGDLRALTSFQSISYVQPHQLIPFNPEQVHFATINKGEDKLIVNSGVLPIALPIGKKPYRFQVQYTYSGKGAEPSHREIVIRTDQGLFYKIEKETT